MKSKHHLIIEQMRQAAKAKRLRVHDSASKPEVGERDAGRAFGVRKRHRSRTAVGA